MKRPSKTAETIAREDFAEGRIVLSQKLEEFAPRVVAFNGKMTYEVFAQRKCKFGLQKESLYGARVYVLPQTPGPATPPPSSAYITPSGASVPGDWVPGGS